MGEYRLVVRYEFQVFSYRYFAQRKGLSSRMRLRFHLAALWLAINSSGIDGYVFSGRVDIPKRAVSPKIVISHFMVGNTYPYNKGDWKRAITLAASRGIDAFALNMGRDTWQPDRVADAYSSAIGTNFKLFISFDMASFPCSSAEDGHLLRDLVMKYREHSNQLIYNGKVFVSTFGGQFCTFGTQHLDEGWKNVFKINMPPIHFVPAFFIEPSTLPGLKSIDGAFCWDSGWPIGNHDITSAYDDAYLTHLMGKTYMAAVSPWFFTHYSRETYNKNFIYRADSWLFVSRWELLIKARKSIDFAQIISWNDYGESHYIGPIDGAQPQSEAWTNGFDHQGWLDLTRYYITAFKTGEYPAIAKDRVFLWARLYPKDADAPDSIGKPLNYNFTEDYLWGIVFLSKPGHLELTCGTSHLSTDLPGGVNKVKLHLENDCNVVARVSRNGVRTVDFSPAGFNFKKKPPSYNFNAFVAASPA